MKPEQLTDERIAELFECADMCDDMSIDENADTARALCELQERRKADSAEPVAWDYEWASCITCEGPQNFERVIEREAPPEWAVDEGQARNIIPLYRHAQSVPDEIEPDDSNTFDYVDGWNACRNAMLNGGKS